eukprot:4331244-Amphidinium_carterae.1
MSDGSVRGRRAQHRRRPYIGVAWRRVHTSVQEGKRVIRHWCRRNPSYRILIARILGMMPSEVARMGVSELADMRFVAMETYWRA